MVLTCMLFPGLCSIKVCISQTGLSLSHDGARLLKSVVLSQLYTHVGRSPLSGLRHSIWKRKNKRAPVCKVIHYNLE